MPAWRALRVVAERGGRGRGDRLEAPFVGRDERAAAAQGPLPRARARRSGRAWCRVIGAGRHRQEPPAWEFSKYLDGVVGDGLVAHAAAPRRTARGSRSGRWARWSATAPGLAETDDEATTRAQARRDRRPLGHRRDGAPLDRARAARPARRRRRGRARPRGAVRGVADVLRADRRPRARSCSCSRTSTGPTRGLLDFIDHLLEWSRGRADPRRHARPAGAARAPAGLGRGHAGTSSRIDLEPLSDAAMRELLAGLVPGPAAGGARRRSSARADGIPLYAVETDPDARRGGPARARGRRLRARRRPDRPRGPRDAPRAHRRAAGRARPGDRAVRDPGRGGARPELHARRRSRR